MSDYNYTRQDDLTPRARRLWRILLPLLVLLLGTAIAAGLITSSPRAKPKAAARVATLVEVTPVTFASHPVMLSAMGSVVAEQLVSLQPEVSGKVVSLNAHFEPGSRVLKGDLLLNIDDADYRLALASATSDVAQAEADLQLEQGNQLVAQKEYQLLGETVSEEELALMLRRPQLASAEATLAAARARLRSAELDLERTRVRSPLNAVVTARAVSLGSRVAPGSELATLVGSDRYRIEAALPSDQITWLQFPDTGQSGSVVRIYNRPVWGDETFRLGTLSGVNAALESEGRMAQALIRLDDPLDNRDGQPVPLLGSFVEVEIEGRPLANAAEIPRSTLHDGHRVWIMDEQGRLDIREVTVAFRQRDTVLISAGLSEGERLVTTTLSAPVQGMQLRLAEASTEQGREQ